MEMLKDRKWAYVLLSVFLAVILWLYVRAEKDPVSDARIRNIPVQITGSQRVERHQSKEHYCDH